MNILLISNYPSDYYADRCTFVYRTVQDFVNIGHEVLVISPERWWKSRGKYFDSPGKKKYGDESANVMRPYYFDFPNRIRVKNYSLGRLNIQTLTRAVKKSLNDSSFKADVVYGHFLFPWGAVAVNIGRYLHIPSVVALGESTLAKHKSIYDRNNMKEVANNFSSIISVSLKNKRYCTEKLDVEKDKVKVFPNGVDTALFYPRDKLAMREKHGLPKDENIVAFLGHHVERKGPLRVQKALDVLSDDVKGIFIGDGPQKPEGEKVLFSKSVTHTKVPELLSAADLFVLPTLNEGSCNAIMEAMACGLPIISSDIEAVREQVDSSRGILVDPMSPSRIALAIEKLFADKREMNEMSKNSLRYAKNHESKERSSKIVNWIKARHLD